MAFCRDGLAGVLDVGGSTHNKYHDGGIRECTCTVPHSSDSNQAYNESIRSNVFVVTWSTHRTSKRNCLQSQEKQFCVKLAERSRQEGRGHIQS